MSFLETIERARGFLERNGRISLRVLQREFQLDADALEELVEELVDVQQVATREGKILSWVGSTGATATAEPAATPAPAGVATAPQAAAGERRQLTVMFCDLVGSTALSEQLDPEDTRTLIRGYQEIAAAAIERFGGHLAKYIGDGIMAYFGYPQAHDDDAERSVRAGLEIRDRLPDLNERMATVLAATRERRISTRIGIHTGVVVAGEMGAGAQHERLAIVGDTPNIAARLEGVAEPDSVVISDSTLRLVPGMFLMKDLGTPPLKGIAEPIRVYAVLQVTGTRSRLGVDPGGRLTPLVGRDQELGLLLERWEQVEEGEGQTVFVSGEAGLGKSRLLQAFRERLAETPHGWLECRCSPYTQGSAFHPLVELMEQGQGFQDGDDPEMKLARLEAGVAAADLSAPDVIPLLAPLLSLPLPDRYPHLHFSPELQRKRTIEALVAWIFGLTELQPQVLLVEDLHWCDASTLEALGWLLEQNPLAKVLTLLSFRPDFEPPWPGRSHITPLAVKRLSRRQATSLIDGMTHDMALPGAVVERVVERADGVPLFLEELTKMVLESELLEEREGRYELTGPIAELAIPTTLQDSLMARLDRLDEGKAVAQLGAALGREFFYELLRGVSLEEEPRLRAGLAQLVDAELLYQRGALPQAKFTFKHALIQETAYRSLLRSVRQQFHARIAKVLEEQFPERAESEPEVVARHYDEAGLAEPAIARYQRAGERATQRSANEEAIGHLRRALDLVGTLPETGERDQQELGLRMAIGTPLAAARGWAHPDYEQTFVRARELTSQIGESPELARVLVCLADVYLVRGDFATAAEIAREALAAAERTGDPFDRLSAHEEVGIALLCQGHFSQALQHFEQTIELYDPSAHGSLAHAVAVDRGIYAHGFAAQCHAVLGHPNQALALSESAVALAKRAENRLDRASGLFFACLVHFERGEYDRTRERAEELVVLAEELGFPWTLGLGRFFRGWVWVESRQGEAGIAEMQQALGELAKISSKFFAPQLLAMLAEGLRTVRRHADALDALDLGVAFAEQQGQHYYDAELHRLRAEILLDTNGDAVEALYGQSLQIARWQEAKTFELRAATSLARLWQRQGKKAEARALLAPVYDWFTEGFDTRDLKEAKALLEELA